MKNTWACLLISILSLCHTAFAAELRVIDNLGLTRAVSSIGESAVITISLLPDGKESHQEEITVVLSNIDGLSPDLKGQPSNRLQYIFNRVRNGTWRIILEPAGLKVGEVKITGTSN